VIIPDGILRTALGLYVLRDDTCLSRWVENENRLDLAANIVEIASFAQYLPDGAVAIDAGACIGDHTVTYSQLVGGTGMVFAFEPHPLTYWALTLNVMRLNNVITFHAALGDATTTQGMTLDPNIGASFLSEDGDTRVPCVTLDEHLLPHLVRCDFIHLDAEGWEPKILRGGRALLARFKPVMVIEVCDKHLRRAKSSEAELLALLDELGYSVRPVPSHIEPELRDVICEPKR
jgi:FkbM family methyltransferase